MNALSLLAMAKVVQFPVNPAPEKLGLQRARQKKTKEPKKPGQLNLFTSAKIIRLNQLSPFDEALMLDEHGDFGQARQGYMKAIAQNDNVADAYCNLAIIESQDGNFARAIDFFTQALKHEPRHYEAHYNLANVYAEVGNLPLAKLHYEIAIELAPSFPNSYYNLGLTLALVKEYQYAVSMLKQYRELTPEEEHKITDDLIYKLSSTL